MEGKNEYSCCLYFKLLLSQMSDDINYRFTEGGIVYDFYDVFIPADIFRQPALWGWGSTAQGQVGTNEQGTNKPSPVTTFAGGSNWKQISCGGLHTAAIKTDGTLWIWGYNSYGQLGTNDTTQRNTPVTTLLGGTNWEQLGSGYGQMAVVKTDGTLWTWGRNNSGQLGINDTTNRSTPVTTLLGGTNWKKTNSGKYHTAAIKTDGTLWLWGNNSIYGACGTNDTTNRNTPVTTLLGGNNWKQVACGNDISAAIKTDGTLWIWGKNADGQLGINNAPNSRITPVTTILGGNNWKSVACGYDLTAAVKTDGTLWLWGATLYGQLGINVSGTAVTRSTPVTTILGGTNWKSVSCGRLYASAIKTDGTLWTWGYNNTQQLGNNDTLPKSTPITTLRGRNNWKSLSCGDNHMMAIQYVPDP